MPKEKKKVAFYVRVSTQEQGEKHGADTQKDELKKWAEYHQYEVFKVYEDNCSGATPVQEREALSELFEDAREKKFDIIAVWKIDRFFRKVLLLLQAVEELQELNIGFVSATQTEIDTTKKTGIFMLQFLGIIAEMERNTILERTAKGKQAAARKGLWVGGKHPPYGYNVDKDTKKMEINEEESQIVRKIFRWYGEDGLTIYDIQARLNAMKILTKSDKHFEELQKKEKAENKKYKNPRTTNKKGYWNTSSITKILNNDTYSGTYFYGKYTTSKCIKTGKTTKKENPKEDWIPITCPQIIGGKLFFKVKQKNEENKLLSKRNSKNDYLLSGKIICGECGSSYTGYMKRKQKTVNGKRVSENLYPQYRCRKKNKSSVQVPCSSREISGGKLEEFIWNEVVTLLDSPQDFIQMVEKENKNAEATKELKEELKIIEDSLEELNTTKLRVLNLYEKGLNYQEEGEVEKRIQEIEDSEKKELGRRDVICSLIVTEEEKQDRMFTAEEIARAQKENLEEADFEKKRTLINFLLKKITINGDFIDIELYLNPPLAGEEKLHQLETLNGGQGQN